MLETRRLTKRYAAIPAVENVSFTLRPGSILGYLGPNGSGKSTTVKMLTGMIEPSAGEILFFGERIDRDPVAYKRRFGYVPEEPYLYQHLTGLEYLELVGGLRGMAATQVRKRATGLMELFGLQEHRHSGMSAYSKGMRQKVLLSAALLHDPELLILDEPFSGLDVSAALVFRSVLQELANAGKMILYSSHVLEVVEKVCSDVVILDRGRVVAQDSVARLRSLMDVPSLEQVFAQLVQEQDSADVARAVIQTMSS